MSKKLMIEWFNENEGIIVETAQKIWGNPEISYEEKYASDLYRKIFKENGFEVKSVEDMPTAFIAEFGEGQPIIGVLGEYDALPGLSQKVSAVKEEVEKGAHGHSCGHNLLGAAGMGAVFAMKEAMEKEGIKGTLRYYGCPAEEFGSAKKDMAKKGVFEGVDVALTWHPFCLNTVMAANFSSIIALKFEYKGRTSHAGASPHTGRSALDAIELMNTGTNYLREHVIDTARIHYIIDNGGQGVNIVPEFASSIYRVRSPYAPDALDIVERLLKIAKGAALMTETELTCTMQGGLYNTLHNDVIGNVMEKNMKEIGTPSFTEDDFKFAEELRNTIHEKDRTSSMRATNVPEELLDVPLHDEILECCDRGKYVTGSTDAGEVSWIAPFAQFATAAFPGGVSPHTWQATAAAGSSIGHKATILAAKTLAGSLYDLFTDDTGIIEKAKEEFNRKTNGKPYTPIDGEIVNFDGR